MGEYIPFSRTKDDKISRKVRMVCQWNPCENSEVFPAREHATDTPEEQGKTPARPVVRIMGRSLAYAAQPTTWLTALLGVAIMEGFFQFAPQIGLTRIDNATANGTHLLPPGKKASRLGYVMFYSGAVSLVSLFRSLGPRIKGPDSAKSLKFGVWLYLFDSIAVMPLLSLTNPYMRRGVLKKPGLFGFGIQGWRTPVSNLIGHLVFGEVIGMKRLNKK